MDPKRGALDRPAAEGSLLARDRVGVQDFVLLEPHTSEGAFVDNLRKRYRQNLIYTYIGTLLVSVNPYKELDIYSQTQMEKYKGVNFFEMPPHIFALADAAYREACSEFKDRLILISGESGAGKTESSKKVLQFLASVAPSSDRLRGVLRDRLLLSNPVLEAFGNAKTLRNDNSSRFGKYMDVQFDFMGSPVGGRILSFLIEKSRVVLQNPGERNFHVFYQLLAGGEEDVLRRMGLERDPRKYGYLVQGGCAKVSSINDRSDWRTVSKAFAVIDFKASDVEDLLAVVGSVLHLGNVHFEEDANGNAIVAKGSPVKWVSKLLGVHLSILQEALTHRKIEARSEEVLSPLEVDLAFSARDALAKAVYGRTFAWLVGRVNGALADRGSGRKTVIGLLDVYGFEVFQRNSFEQLCINYCNEKLHRLLLQATLEAEQEDYMDQGIQWEPIPYFDNKIICDLIEEKHKGILSILDEECLRPGEATDLSFLEKLEEKVGCHAHFLTRKIADQKTRKTIGFVDFRLLHYAGEVTYCAVGFLEKNNDLLYRNLKEVLCNSKNGILRECFHPSELDDRRRPETVAMQFKKSLASLIEILVSKEPSYIRCIKPNHDKEPDKFDEALIRHQVKYLGLMEHLRVRRAGFAYRRKYEHFLNRYKALCPATWPKWEGPAAQGVALLVKHLGFRAEEYQMGRTKLFIRFPRTLFATEDAFEKRKHRMIARIQAKYKGCLGKREFQKMREAAIKLESCWRGVLARKLAKRRLWAARTIRKYIKGFICRKQPLNPNNRDFVRLAQHSYLMRLRDRLPKGVLDPDWLEPPEIMKETSELLRRLCIRNLVRKYCRSIPPERKNQLDQKVVASAIFRGKKAGYDRSRNEPFAETRISESELSPKVMQMIRHEKVKYVTRVLKFDPKAFKPRERILVLTRVAAYLLESGKIRHKFEYSGLRAVSVSNLSDGMVVLHVSEDCKTEKADAVLQCEYVFETVTRLAILAKREELVRIVQGSLDFQMGPGKEGTMVFATGPEPQVYKAKTGQLTVVTPPEGRGEK